MTEQFKNPGQSMEEMAKTITEQAEKIAEQAERIAKLEQKASSDKGLYTIIAHDLRGPVATIVQNEYVINNPSSFGANEADLDVFKKSNLKRAEDLLKLIDNLLDWGKDEMNGLELNISNFTLKSKVEETVNFLKDRIKDKNITFKNEIEYNLDISSDDRVLERVIYNLCSNAIKFTNKDGNITVSAEKSADSVKIIISDDGVGLTKEQEKNILNNLGVSNDGTKGEKGTGLGLYLCGRLVKKLGGNISVKSEGLGKGTTFTIELPSN